MVSRRVGQECTASHLGVTQIKYVPVPPEALIDPIAVADLSSRR
jgi:hypothetical protein